MHLEDWLSILEIDLTFTATIVLGRPKRTPNGLPIGSPVSAGGATLGASWRERVVWCLQSHDLKQEFWRKVFLFRWPDDVLLVTETMCSPALEYFLRVITSPHFYGKRLLLKPVAQAEAFGFRIAIKDGLLELRPKLKYGASPLPPPVPAGNLAQSKHVPPVRLCELHGGQQYRSANVDFAVAIGHCIRTLDTMNAAQMIVLSSVGRVILELFHIGFRRTTLHRALMRVQGQASCPVRDIAGMLRWSYAERRQWCLEYDGAENLRCAIEDGVEV